MKTSKSELKTAMKKITIFKNEFHEDIKTIETDETACRNLISLEIKTKDQVVVFIRSKYVGSNFLSLVRQNLRNVSSSQQKASSTST